MHRRGHTFIARLFALLSLVLFAACSSASTEDVGRVQDAIIYATGVDYSFARPSPSGLKADGFTFACRYLSTPPNSKNLSKSEADALWGAGVDVVANFEDGATNALGGHAQGVNDAKVADGEARADGIPSGRPIYFSVDFDAVSADFAAIDAYFDGVASVIGVSRTGAYGGYAVVKHLFDAGKIRWGWQTYAWSGGAWDDRAQLRQVLNDITAAGDSACCDKDEAVARDFGQWHPGTSDPCASTLDGVYCGQSPQWIGGAKDHLYTCHGGATEAEVDCPGGCIIEPPGKADQCAPYDAGPSDAGHDASPEGDAEIDARADARPIDAGAQETSDASEPEVGVALAEAFKGGCAMRTHASDDADALVVALAAAMAMRRRRRAKAVRDREPIVESP